MKNSYHLKKRDYTHLIKKALKEDCFNRDITSKAIIPKKYQAHANIILKENAIIAGLPIIIDMVHYVSKNIKIQLFIEEGSFQKKNTTILSLYGSLVDILKLERSVLNFLSFLSGIATTTHEMVKYLSKKDIQLVDTRKTIPLYRNLSKYATSLGGAKNHRLHLEDMGLIKDNHKLSFVSLKKQMQLFKKKYPKKLLEVEVENYLELQHVLQANPHYIMLDNMKYHDLAKCIQTIKQYNKQNNTHIFIEVSGGYSRGNLDKLKNLNFDYLSSSSITMNVQSINFSLDIVDN